MIFLPLILLSVPPALLCDSTALVGAAAPLFAAHLYVAKHLYMCTPGLGDKFYEE